MVVFGFLAAGAAVLAARAAVQVVRDGRPSVAEQVAANLRAVRGPVAAESGLPAEVGVSSDRPSPTRAAAGAAGAAGLHVGRHLAAASLKSGLLTARIGGRVGFALLKMALKK